MTECQRMQLVQSPIIPVVGELIKSNPGTISLGQGVVNYGPPPEAVEAVTAFFAGAANHKYKLVQGIPELLERIRHKLETENRVRITGDNQVMVTAGGNMAFMNAVLAISDPGDEFILQVPYYFNHEMAVTIAGCRAVCVPTDRGYQLQPERIAEAVTPRTRAVVTISPNNPSGAVYPEEALREVNQLCAERGLYHIHDEAYEYFTYEGAVHFSPGAIDGSAGHTISLFSLSKSHGFASWRIGYMVFPARLYASMRKIQDTILICPPVVSQFAAVAALEAGVDYCRQMAAPLANVRRLALDKFASISDLVDAPISQGAFYFLLRVHTEMDLMTLVERLIREHRVAVIPGSTFGIEEGCCLRVAFGALDEHTVADGIDRLVTGLRAILG